MLGVAACRPPAGAPDVSGPAITIVDVVPGTRVIDVVGLDRDALADLSKATEEEQASALRVHVEGTATSGVPAMSGSYAVVGDRFRFTPAFPLDDKLAYRASFQRRSATPLELAIPARVQQPSAPSTRVTSVYPPDTLLENQLRVYVHFSGPMSNRPPENAIRLLDDRGNEVEDPFLPIDVHLWNEDRSRYTLLFDPGRVKRGILPNMEKGRALVPGRTYTLVVDREWHDAEGRPLVETFRRDFRVVPAVVDPIVPDRWRIASPRAGTREPLTVTFPRPLDHALAHRMLFVTTAQGSRVEGVVAVDAAVTGWAFTPNQPWTAGDYRLRALSELEDAAGNRIGRAFDYDAATAGSTFAPDGATADKEVTADRHAEAVLPFTVR
jgi:hypothetical protein